jgi:small ligand-binding sensory domain FIST
MKWASALSLRLKLEEAVSEASAEIERTLPSGEADLLVAFPSRGHLANCPRLPRLLQKEFPRALVLGCAGEGVIGGGHEAEGVTALSLLAARLPRVQIHPFRLGPEPLPSLDESPEAWRGLVGQDSDAAGLAFILLADPFTTDAETILAGLDYAYPLRPKIGGFASAASRPGENVLLLSERSYSEGVVGVALSGHLRMDTVVAQGGRPIGRPASVTKCRQNVLFELDGRPALEILQESCENLSEALSPEQPVGFFLGFRADSFGSDSAHAEFVVRNIMGVDQRVGAIAVANLLREGQSVQFQLVSARSAEDDLRELLSRYRKRGTIEANSGAFLFSCNGRGRNLFGMPDHDLNLFHEVLEPRIPLAGFFCAGEIGPVGDATYVHGYTSSFGIIRPGVPSA